MCVGKKKDGHPFRGSPPIRGTEGFPGPFFCALGEIRPKHPGFLGGKNFRDLSPKPPPGKVHNPTFLKQGHFPRTPLARLKWPFRAPLVSQKGPNPRGKLKNPALYLGPRQSGLIGGKNIPPWKKKTFFQFRKTDRESSLVYVFPKMNLDQVSMHISRCIQDAKVIWNTFGWTQSKTS